MGADNSGYSPKERLEELLLCISTFRHQKRFLSVGSKLTGNLPFDRLQHFSQALLSGALPDAETMEFVAIAIDSYVTSEGKLSLDEAFKLKSKPGVGNPSGQRASRNEMNGHMLEMSFAIISNPNLAIRKAAELVAGDQLGISVETLEREWRRRRKANTPASDGK